MTRAILIMHHATVWAELSMKHLHPSFSAITIACLYGYISATKTKWNSAANPMLAILLNQPLASSPLSSMPLEFEVV